MILFERDELVPFKYEIGINVMGRHDGQIEYVVCGLIVERKQSTSVLSTNNYRIEGEYNGWLSEKEIILFDEQLWKKVETSWIEYNKSVREQNEKYQQFRSSWYR